LLVGQLLARGHRVRAIARSERLPESFKSREHLSLITASILGLSDAELIGQVNGCDAVASCLGHNLTWKGVFGHPRRLVAESTRRLCEAIRASRSAKPVKFVLMNTAGNSNRDLDESLSLPERSVIALLRVLLPPHADNEAAADYLRVEVGQHDRAIEWAVVRPDNLVNEERVTAYEVHPSPTRSAIFNAGSTSRINVGHFMAELIADDGIWQRWKGQMPVIYNKGL
jgi:nucleoside-diphosphate-sugar epimerase